MMKFLTALLVAAMLLMATSVSWGANGNGNGNGYPPRGGVGNTTGATWE